MKILIYGAGVIGCTYGWQLANAGYDITLLVRKRKAEIIEKEGVNINCNDFRSGEKQETEVSFNPQVIDTLSPENDFDYIIVSVASSDLKSVLPVLSASADKAHIIFFLNMWDEFNDIAGYLNPDRYSLGFPFMAGGGRNGNTINAIISGSKYSKTMLGNVNGNSTPAMGKICLAFEKANMRPFVSHQMINWLIPHYVFIAAMSAGIITAGGRTTDFLKHKRQIKETLKAIREGFDICSKGGIDPKQEKVNQLYYFPSFICIPIMKKIFSSEDMASMFDGYLQHAGMEIRYMLGNVISSGKEEGLKTIHLERLSKF